MTSGISQANRGEEIGTEKRRSPLEKTREGGLRRSGGRFREERKYPLPQFPIRFF